MAVPFDQRAGPDLVRRQARADVGVQDQRADPRAALRQRVFEGERAYGGTIYKGTEHSERLKRSANILDFEIPYSVAEIDAAKRLVLETNDQKDAYVRAIAWRGSEQLGVSAQQNKIHLAIATWEWPSYFDPAQRLKGIRLDLAEYRRPDPATAPCLAKAAGLYMICTISKHRAERKGYADAMMLDWQGRVAECTGANIFFIKDGKIHTPIADCFLAGITRATAIMLAKKRGIEVIERRIMPDELSNFSRMLHHRHGGRGHGGVRDRAVEVHAGRHHQAADGRLHRRSAAEGQGRGGVTRRAASAKLLGVEPEHLAAAFLGVEPEKPLVRIGALERRAAAPDLAQQPAALA